VEIMKYTVEQMAKNRWIYTFEGKNSKKESLVVEVTKVICDLKDKKSLMNLWKKHGFIKDMLPTYWDIDTYVTDSEENCWMKYNPTAKKAEDGAQGNVIDFDWILEATEENLQKLLREIYRQFSLSSGKSATEIKMDKINEYAEKYNMKVYKTIPEGFKKLNFDLCSSLGAVLITNGKSFRSGKLERALLLI